MKTVRPADRRAGDRRGGAPHQARAAPAVAGSGQPVPCAAGAARRIRLERPLRLFRGGVLSEVEIAYECWGRLSEGGDNAVLLFTGLSPDAHAASSEDNPAEGWWEYMVGLGRPIDTGCFFVVCINSLGSCFGSTGPASPDPATGEPYRLDFPELSVEDIAAAGMALVRALGIERLHTVVGASLGGMSALALAILHPAAVERLVCISAAASATPYAIAVRSLQRDIVRSDPKWNGGRYDPADPPRTGMRLARKLGLISYRSAEEFAQRFGRRYSEPEAPFAPAFEVEAYLDYNAAGFADQFDANCYLYLSRAIDRFDAAAHGGSLQAAFGRLRTRANLIIGVTTDHLFPCEQQRLIAKTLERSGHPSRFVELPSIQGHDAFLIDQDRFAPVVEAFFHQSRSGG